MTSFVIYYSTHAQQNEIYLFYTSILLFFIVFLTTNGKTASFSHSSMFRAKTTSKFSLHQSGINSAMFSSMFFVKSANKWQEYTVKILKKSCFVVV